MARKKKRRRADKATVKKSRLKKDMKEFKVKVPVYKKMILFSKIVAVFLFAIGLEFLVQDDILMAFVFFIISIIIILLPIKVQIDEEE